MTMSFDLCICSRHGEWGEGLSREEALVLLPCLQGFGLGWMSLVPSRSIQDRERDTFSFPGTERGVGLSALYVTQERPHFVS